MKFNDAVKQAFVKAATFDGRASRSEFWWFSLFWLLASIGAGILDNVLFPVANPAEPGIRPISTCISLGLLIPSITVAARRLHDTGRSGWWMLIQLTIIGIIPYIYWLCKQGDAGPNKYGVEPSQSA